MLKISNLQKEYPNFHLQCSMEVLPGQIVGLVGKNGAGKTTIFKTSLGLIGKDGGNIQFFDQELTCKLKQDIGVVLADSSFSGYLTIKDVIAILKATYNNFQQAKFLEYCQRFELPLNKKIKDFSTGMKVKLKLIVALSHEAKLLILDEPTTGLDVLAREDILDLLRLFMVEDDQRSILISSHIASDLEGLCDRLYMIDQGKIVFEETMDTLLNDYAILKVSEAQYAALDKSYILKKQHTSFGFELLTKERRFYLENFPMIIIEKANIDTVITMMVKGE
ncbi:MAG: ABC transporter ATP-binding protein [Erysipelotrichaceae bacterium]|nr:ABC transporter ATP-binding protein [Erysipelotrichaceae bacterium]MDY5252159.1 ABC transporter ATP-binding protein [Erysipelotrichaceae bacterium]